MSCDFSSSLHFIHIFSNFVLFFKVVHCDRPEGTLHLSSQNSKGTTEESHDLTLEGSIRTESGKSSCEISFDTETTAITIPETVTTLPQPPTETTMITLVPALTTINTLVKPTTKSTSKTTIPDCNENKENVTKHNKSPEEESESENENESESNFLGRLSVEDDRKFSEIEKANKPLNSANDCCIVNTESLIGSEEDNQIEEQYSTTTSEEKEENVDQSEETCGIPILNTGNPYPSKPTSFVSIKRRETKVLCNPLSPKRT